MRHQGTSVQEVNDSRYAIYVEISIPRMEKKKGDLLFLTLICSFKKLITFINYLFFFSSISCIPSASTYFIDLILSALYIFLALSEKSCDFTNAISRLNIT
jgi:hypothetical protein